MDELDDPRSTRRSVPGDPDGRPRSRVRIIGAEKASDLVGDTGVERSEEPGESVSLEGGHTPLESGARMGGGVDAGVVPTDSVDTIPDPGASSVASDGVYPHTQQLPAIRRIERAGGGASADLAADPGEGLPGGRDNEGAAGEDTSPTLFDQGPDDWPLIAVPTGADVGEKDGGGDLKSGFEHDLDLDSDVSILGTRASSERSDDIGRVGSRGETPVASPGEDPIVGSEDSQGLGAAHPELPHWTSPPTGQVPAVLDRGRGVGDEATGAASAPVWREHAHEWEQGDNFEDALVDDDEMRIGQLADPTPLEERRPWEFDSGELWLSDESPEVDGRQDDDLDGWIDDEGVDVEEVRGTRSGAAGAAAASVGQPRIRVLGAEPLRGGGPRHDESLAGQGVGRGTPGHRARERVTARAQVRRSGSRRSAPPRESDGGYGDEGPDRNLPTAIAVGVILGAAGLVCAMAGPSFAALLVVLVLFLAVHEVFATLEATGRRPARLVGWVATVALLYTAYNRGTAGIPLVVGLTVAATMVWYLVGAGKGSAVEGISTTLFGFLWVGGLGMFGCLLLSPTLFPNRHGIAFFWAAVLVSVGSDLGGLVVGRLAGRHQLAPAISPGKTWEGLAGGLVGSIILSVAFTAQIHPWTLGDALLVGVVGGVVAPVGDLCQSLVKRDLDVKDMGIGLPGHGGVMDRFDAMLFVLPATYYLIRVLHLG